MSVMSEDHFPTRRNVLWDRTTSGIVRHLPSGPRPVLSIPTSVSRYMGYRRGSLLTHSRTAPGVLHLAVERYDNLPYAEVSSDMTVIHCLPELDSDQLQEISTYRNTSTMQEKGPIPCDKFFALSCIAFADRYSSTVRIELLAKVPRIPFVLKPLLYNVPLQSDNCALSKRLLTTRRGGKMEFGYVTLDKTRKAIPLLETDPAALKTPLVGVWVDLVNVYSSERTTPGGATSGDEMEDLAEASGDRTIPIAVDQVDHPLIWQACMRFVTSQNLHNRIFISPKTFLCLALYRGPQLATEQEALTRSFEVNFSTTIAGEHKIDDGGAAATIQTTLSKNRVVDLETCGETTYAATVELDYDEAGTTNSRKTVELQLCTPLPTAAAASIRSSSSRQKVVQESFVDHNQFLRTSHNASFDFLQRGDVSSLIVKDDINPGDLLPAEEAAGRESGSASPSQRSPKTEVFWSGGRGLGTKTEKNAGQTGRAGGTFLGAGKTMNNKHTENNLLLQATDDLDHFAAQWSALKKQCPPPRIGLDDSTVSSWSKNEKLWGFLQKQQDQLLSLQQKVTDLTSALAKKAASTTEQKESSSGATSRGPRPDDQDAEERSPPAQTSHSVAVNTSIQFDGPSTSILSGLNLGFGAAATGQQQRAASAAAKNATSRSAASAAELVQSANYMLETAPYSHLSSIVGPLRTVVEEQHHTQGATRATSSSSSTREHILLRKSQEYRDTLEPEQIEQFREVLSPVNSKNSTLSSGKRSVEIEVEHPGRSREQIDHHQAHVRSRAPDREIGFHKVKKPSHSKDSTDRMPSTSPRSSTGVHQDEEMLTETDPERSENTRRKTTRNNGEMKTPNSATASAAVTSVFHQQAGGSSASTNPGASKPQVYISRKQPPPQSASSQFDVVKKDKSDTAQRTNQNDDDALSISELQVLKQGSSNRKNNVKIQNAAAPASISSSPDAFTDHGIAADKSPSFRDHDQDDLNSDASSVMSAGWKTLPATNFDGELDQFASDEEEEEEDFSMSESMNGTGLNDLADITVTAPLKVLNFRYPRSSARKSSLEKSDRSKSPPVLGAGAFSSVRSAHEDGGARNATSSSSATTTDGLSNSIIPVSAQGALRMKARAQDIRASGSSVRSAAGASGQVPNDADPAELAVTAGKKNANKTAKPRRALEPLPKIQYEELSSEEEDGDDDGAADRSISRHFRGTSSLRNQIPSATSSDDEDDAEVNAILAKYTSRLK
ncbi:unnamed protein product [Amoebophrya sp. A120]|nr:unnamed protein product [Amoebophrya sp. A120]|eukprot:GSA120T00004298001.1